MAKKIRIPNLMDEDAVQALIDRVTTKGWVRAHIGQPVNWPEVNRFLEDAKGTYLTVSRPGDPMAVEDSFWSTNRRYRQNFWFSDANAAFDFKMRYG